MLGLLLAVPVTGGATASERSARVVPARTATVATAADADEVLAYWTRRRMAAALPLGLDAAGDLLVPRTGAAPRTSARATTSTPRSAGKLFFTTPGGDAVCSAAAVNTAQKNVIITAAHCAHTGPGGLLSPSRYFTNFLFVPRYRNGSAPDGRWVGARAVTHSQWVRNGDLAYDQALIEVLPRNGRRLVDVVGGNGLAWNHPPRQTDVRVWGWPAESPYSGEYAHRCAGSTSSFAGSGDAKIACAMNGGASGGPWYLGMLYRDVGFIWAITSRRTTSGTKYLIAYPLTGAIRNLLAATRDSSALAATPAPARPAMAHTTGSAPAPTSGRLAARAGGIRFRAVRRHEGRGQVVRLRARTTRDTRIVLRVKLSRRASWQVVDVKRTNSDGIVEFRHRPRRAGLRWYHVRTQRASSDPVRVRVHWCPLPYQRSRAVVDAIDCTNPAR